MESNSVKLIHFNADTQGDEFFSRRDIVVVKRLDPERINLDWHSKRIGMKGEVSAVYPSDRICSVLLEDGYWIDFSYDEIEKIGDQGKRFCEIFTVPSPWG